MSNAVNDFQLPALSKGVLSHYTKQDLLDMRTTGMSNAEIAHITGATATMVIRAIGTQPTAAERIKLWDAQRQKATKQEQTIAEATTVEAPKTTPVPVVTKVADKTTMQLCKLCNNGFQFDIDLTDNTICIMTAACDSIYIKATDLEKFTESLFNVAEIIDKLKKIL